MNPIRYALLVLLALAPALAVAQLPDSLHVDFTGELPAWGADFGARFDADKNVGPLPGEVAQPVTACDPLANPEEVEGNIVLIRRGECSYVTKVQHASAAGAAAVIVFNDDMANPDSLIWMRGECGVADGCTAPAAFISRHSGEVLLDTPVFKDITIIPIRVAPPVSVEEAAPEGAFALAPVYPNPAASHTAIGLGLPTAQMVSVMVYDVLGREVALLHDGPLAAGAHRFVFDAARLPSGLYLVKATGAAYSATRKLVVAR